MFSFRQKRSVFVQTEENVSVRVWREYFSSVQAAENVSIQGSERLLQFTSVLLLYSEQCTYVLYKSS